MTSMAVPIVVGGEKPTSSAPIEAGGWFPPIDPDRFRREQRVEPSLTADRVRQALIAAIITVVRDLADWQRGHRADGVASLANVPTDLPVIDGEPPLVLLYRRAVALNAKAELIERYRDTDITGAGQRDAEALNSSIGELRRDATFAVRDMLNASRTTVELI